jgi:hypothetical protein
VHFQGNREPIDDSNSQGKQKNRVGHAKFCPTLSPG